MNPILSLLSLLKIKPQLGKTIEEVYEFIESHETISLDNLEAWFGKQHKSMFMQTYFLNNLLLPEPSDYWGEIVDIVLISSIFDFAASRRRQHLSEKETRKIRADLISMLVQGGGITLYNKSIRDILENAKWSVLNSIVSERQGNISSFEEIAIMPSNYAQKKRKYKVPNEEFRKVLSAIYVVSPFLTKGSNSGKHNAYSLYRGFFNAHLSIMYRSDRITYGIRYIVNKGYNNSTDTKYKKLDELMANLYFYIIRGIPRDSLPTICTLIINSLHFDSSSNVTFFLKLKNLNSFSGNFFSELKFENDVSVKAFDTMLAGILALGKLAVWIRESGYDYMDICPPVFEGIMNPAFTFDNFHDFMNYNILQHTIYNSNFIDKDLSSINLVSLLKLNYKFQHEGYDMYRNLYGSNLHDQYSFISGISPPGFSFYTEDGQIFQADHIAVIDSLVFGINPAIFLTGGYIAERSRLIKEGLDTPVIEIAMMLYNHGYLYSNEYEEDINMYYAAINWLDKSALPQDLKNFIHISEIGGDSEFIEILNRNEREGIEGGKEYTSICKALSADDSKLAISLSYVFRLFKAGFNEITAKLREVSGEGVPVCNVEIAVACRNTLLHQHLTSLSHEYKDELPKTNEALVLVVKAFESVYRDEVMQEYELLELNKIDAAYAFVYNASNLYQILIFQEHLTKAYRDMYELINSSNRTIAFTTANDCVPLYRDYEILEWLDNLNSREKELLEIFKSTSITKLYNAGYTINPENGFFQRKSGSYKVKTYPENKSVIMYLHQSGLWIGHNSIYMAGAYE
jgi:hypothetical protein